MTFKNSSLGWGLLTAALAVGGLAQAAPVPGQGTWETTLEARDINGDGTVDAYYDSGLNITWLADAKAGAGSKFDSSIDGTGFGSPTDGLMNWRDAMSWADSLDVYGMTGWRLPTMTDTSAPGCEFSYEGGTDCGHNVDVKNSELAHLYYLTLGNLAYCPPGDADCRTEQAGWGLTNTGPFVNLQPGIYWSGVAYAPYPADYAWFLNFNEGSQSYVEQYGELYALAVRPGDVTAAVPEPQTYLLMLLGLGAITVAARRRRST